MSPQPAELTVKAVVLGLILAFVFGSANAYLGMKAGQTVAATIPAAVIAMGNACGLTLSKAANCFASSSYAKITNPVTLEQLVKDQPLIFTAKVTEFLPDKPGLVFTPVDKLRGEFPFDRVPVNLSGDKEAIDEKQPALLLERLEKDLPFVVFASRRGRTIDAVAFTNGTWIRLAGQVEKDGEKEITRWRFLHCETYFRRTFKGTTQEMIDAVKSGLKGGKLPAYNEKEEPGYGPPLKKAKEGGGSEKNPLENSSLLTPHSSLPFAVIQLPFLGLIVALAALFPAVFGGAAIMMRRWVGALSVASFISILAALAVYFPSWIAWTGIRSLSTMWIVGTVICGLGAFWTSYRYRRAIREGKSEEFQPRYLDRSGLAVVVLLIAGGLTVVHLLGESLRESPWLELVLLLVPTVACLGYVLLHFLRTSPEPIPVAVSAETVGVWAGMFACAITGVAIWPDVYDRAADTSSFSVFVSGLSNGWTEDDNKVIRRKTLQLNFRKLSDAKTQDSDTIQWVDNPSWIYRASNFKLDGAKPMAIDPKLKQ